MTDSPILVSRKGAVTHIRLNRPRAINALNLTMVELLIEAFDVAWNDGSQAILLDGEGDRGFCGGGDIKEMVSGGPEGARAFVKREYVLDQMTHDSPIPVIGIMDGVTMGGGIGLTGHAAVRVVTERSRLAMPEARIGIMPDVGGNLLLARAPGRLGEYLGVTAANFGAGDAIAIGFADLYVPTANLQHLRERLFAAPADAFDVLGVVRASSEPAPPAELIMQQEWIDQLFEGVLGGEQGIDLALVQEPGASQLAAWAVRATQRLMHVAEHSGQPNQQGLAKTMREMSPTSLAVTIAQIARTRALSLPLDEVLRDDYRILHRLFQRPDFAEGVRARVIDKDNSPAWSPRRVEDLDAAEVASILDLNDPEAPTE